MLVNRKCLFGCTLADGKIPVTLNPIIRIPGKHSRGKANLDISWEQLNSHAVLIGATGCGKTNTINFFIEQLQRQLGSNDIMIVFDSKLDFKKFHRKGDIIISSDKKACSHYWNIFKEILADGTEQEAIYLNADEISETCFYKSIKESSQPFFPAAARDIFSAVLKAITLLGLHDETFRIRFWNNMTLSKYFNNVNAKKLNRFLETFEDLKGVLKYIGNGSSDQALGVFAEFQAVVSKLFVKSFNTDDGMFGIRNAAKKRMGKTIFVEYDSALGSSLQNIYRLMFDLFFKETLSNDQVAGKVIVICDELKMLPNLNHLEDALNFGRSKGISIIAGIQSVEQLYEVYGENEGRNILSAFQTSFVFHSNNHATKEYVRNIHGKNLINIQYINESNNLTDTHIDGNTVEDWDMNELKRGEAIIGLPYEQPFKYGFDRYGG